MKIIVVDDEELAVAYIERLLKQVAPEGEFFGFTEPEEALEHLLQHGADIALLDIELGTMDGLELATRCRKLCPQINIIFVTSHSQYTIDAFKLRVSGYLMKPIRAEELRAELDNLRHPLPPDTYRRVRVQTFGNFEIFVDGKPFKLPLSKCRECLAYLIDRKGALITVAQLAAVLWEEKPFDRALQNRAHQVVSTLMKALKEAGVDSIIIKHTRGLGVDPEQFDCDYYRALTGDAETLTRFSGEYMSNYSWSEFTVGELIALKENVSHH